MRKIYRGSTFRNMVLTKYLKNIMFEKETVKLNRVPLKDAEVLPNQQYF